MKFKKQELFFLPDKNGKKCIVPDIDINLSKEFSDRHDFLFFVIRQLNPDGVPNGLYLKDVSNWRTPEQNNISKYKFQSLKTSDNVNEFNVVKLKPGDKLDLPEYTKNQKEYACFENLTKENCEMVCVFSKKPVEDIIDPVPSDFTTKFEKLNGEIIETTPIFTSDGKLYYKEIQDYLDQLNNSIPSSDLSTHYDIYTTGYNYYDYAIISKKHFTKKMFARRESLPESWFDYLKGYDTVRLTCKEKKEYIFSLKDINDQSLSQVFKLKLFDLIKRIIIKTERNNISKEKIDDFIIEVNNIYLDPDYYVKLNKNINSSRSYNECNIYIKKEDVVNFLVKSLNIKDCYGIWHTFKFQSISDINFNISLEYITNEILRTTHSKNGEITNLTLNNNANKIDMWSLLFGKVDIRYCRDEIVTIDNHQLKFSLSEKYKGYLADITDIINEQKKSNRVYHYFKTNTDKYAFKVVQYEKDKIYLSLSISKDKEFLDMSSTYFIGDLKKVSEIIKEINYRQYSSNGLDIVIVGKKSKRILEKYHFDCDIEAVFANGSSLFTKRDWYVTNLDLSELNNKYNNKLSSISKAVSPTADITELEDVKIGSILVHRKDKLYYPDNVNINNYRDRYGLKFSKKINGLIDNKYVDFYIPENITSKKGQPLAFSSIELSKNFLLFLEDNSQ